MLQSLADLESQRSSLLQQFLTLGDFRPGTVSAAARRCGKRRLPLRPARQCRASAVSSAAQGSRQERRRVVPQSGSVSPSGRASQRVPPFSTTQRGVDCFESANLPPTPGRVRAGWLERGGEKTAAAIHQEVAREVQTLLQVIFGAQRKSPALDLEAVEMAVRNAMHRAGAAALSRLLSMECRPSRAGGMRLRSERALPR